MSSQLNVAERYLLWRLRKRAAPIVEPQCPHPQMWHHRYKEPPSIFGPTPEPEVDVNELTMSVACLADLEAKGMLWRGPVARGRMDLNPKTGWGFTTEGLKELRRICDSTEPAQWVEARQFWSDLLSGMQREAPAQHKEGE